MVNSKTFDIIQIDGKSGVYSLDIEMSEDVNKENETRKYKIFLQGLLIHLLLLLAVFDIYFASVLDHTMTPIRSTDSPPAKRLVLIVADGVRAETIFEEKIGGEKFLTDKITKLGSWGTVYSGVPTESRTYHVAMLTGIYENPSTIFRSWRSNPVDFDSILNQSSNAWAWGSSSVINIFKEHNSSKTHLYAYDPESVDVLDVWVFQNIDKFLRNEVLTCKENCDMYHSGGNFFFLHLNGVDSQEGPSSQRYKNEVKLLNENIRKSVAMVEYAFPDRSTAYIFTSGSSHESEIPFIAWGAGIRRGVERQIINHIDVAPLIASLIGINIPIHSLGFLPTDLLDVELRYMADMILSNTLQLHEIFNVKRRKIKDNAIVFFPFANVPCGFFEKEINRSKELLIKGDFLELINKCRNFRNLLIEGNCPHIRNDTHRHLDHHSNDFMCEFVKRGENYLADLLFSVGHFSSLASDGS
ncbi:hypothetical protein JTB14_004343 [Gonioctena quinquepunctata]|nr:hypothetical protein JTB14_004343 [Gonioctena quinquepunctata]